jgi:putative DNA primase/helicase
MNHQDKIDTDGLKASVNIKDVVGRYVVLKKDGAEWAACCPFHTEATPSFKVNENKQLFHCFGCGVNGDVIKFVMEYERVDFLKACEIITGGNPISPPRDTRAAPKKKDAAWIPVLPVPDHAFDPPKSHPYRGEPEAVYPYRNAEGVLLGYTFRLKKSDGGKEVCPLVWARNADTGEEMWRWLSFPEPRPLYGLDRLRDREPVLLVEGEKCADAGQAHQEDFAVVTWPGGGKAVGKADFSPLAGRMVVIWPDCDSKRVKLTKAEEEAGVDPESKPFLPEEKQPGLEAARKIAAILLALGAPANVFRVPIPPPGEKPDGWDIADEIEAGLSGPALVDHVRSQAAHVSAEFLAGVKVGENGGDKPPRGRGSRSGERDRPEIRLAGGRLVDAMREVEDILFSRGEPPYFQRGGMLQWINRIDRVRKRGTEEVIERGALALTPVETGWLRALMMERCEFVRWHDKAKDWLPVNLPKEYPESYIARGNWWVPVLRAVVEAPFVRADGTIAHKPGYDPASGIYLDTDIQWKLPPERKRGEKIDPGTDTAVLWAKGILEDLFESFAPEAGVDMAVLISALLTALQKTEIGASPGVVITAPVFGCGKGKLADIISIVMTGRTAPMMTLPCDSRGKVDEKELHNKLGSALLAGDRMICIDEVRGELDSASLDSMMTQDTVPYRVLGASRNATLRPTEAMYFALGNNMRVRADASRRWIGCYLNPGCDNPHLRTNLRDTIAYARKHRVKIAAACLTLLHGFMHQACPNPTGVALGSYERWAAQIAACVVWAGYPDPVKSQERWREQDEGKNRLAAVLEAWHAKWVDCRNPLATEPVTAGEVCRVVNLTVERAGESDGFDGDLSDAILEIASDKGKANVNRLGKYLAANAKRVVNGYWIEPSGEKKHAKLWRVFKKPVGQS